jgi:F0F1-type ATP synthase delta subunit
MALKISRRKLAKWSADRLVSGDPMKNVMHELGAYLIDSGRVREIELIVRDIKIALLASGTVLVRTTSARPLSSEAKQSIESFIRDSYGAKASVVFDETIDVSVIGGVKLETPDKQIDATIKTKLEKLTA